MLRLKARQDCSPFSQPGVPEYEAEMICSVCVDVECNCFFGGRGFPEQLNRYQEYTCPDGGWTIPVGGGISIVHFKAA
jgi:hypothetical protein